MSKYNPLWKYIVEQDTDRVKLTFDEIGQISGVELNHSFLNCKKELLAYGWRVGIISMKEKQLYLRSNPCKTEFRIKGSKFH